MHTMIRMLSVILWLTFIGMSASSCYKQDGVRPPAAPSESAKQDASSPAASDKKRPLKCFKTCREWGQSCVDVPQGGRRCHKTCMRFGEECFEAEESK